MQFCCLRDPSSTGKKWSDVQRDLVPRKRSPTSVGPDTNAVENGGMDGTREPSLETRNTTTMVERRIGLGYGRIRPDPKRVWGMGRRVDGKRCLNVSSVTPALRGHRGRTPSTEEDRRVGSLLESSIPLGVGRGTRLGRSGWVRHVSDGGSVERRRLETGLEPKKKSPNKTPLVSPVRGKPVTVGMGLVVEIPVFFSVR